MFASGFKKTSNDDSGGLIKLGIFGTFLGIFVALFGFDPSNIKDGIPVFLGGMRIAFLTSVTGMLLSLILDRKISESINNDAGIGDLIHALNSGSEIMYKKIDSINNAIGVLGKSITGDGDGSLLSQLTLLRSNINDKLTDLTGEFRTFAKLQAENNTKALVEAIREVIGDFNAKINEQFGENFKELNAAVGDLVGWQENYKEVVEKSFGQFQIAVESMEKSKELFESIHNRYKDNLAINDDVKTTLHNLSIEHETLEAKMTAFSSLANDAKEAFPVIQENVDKMTKGFSEKVTDSITAVNDAYKSQTDNNIRIVTEMSEATDGVLTSMKDSVQSSNDAIRTVTTQMQESVDESMNNISDRIVKGFNDSMVNIEQLQQKFADNIEGTIVQVDDALRQELEKSLQSLGTQLASLSKRFVDDYSDLTNRMQQVVSIAES